MQVTVRYAPLAPNNLREAVALLARKPVTEARAEALKKPVRLPRAVGE
jgi:hypothetical protein